MASISTDANGNRTIRFIDGDRRRRKICLGKTFSLKDAREIRAKVETLNAATIGGHSYDAETAIWLRGLLPHLHDKLAIAGLVKPRGEAAKATLGAFVNAYLDGRTDLKLGTKYQLERVRDDLVKHFGADKPLADVTEGCADDFRVALRKRLNENTVRRRCARARQFFRAAIKRRLIKENPFGEMKGLAVKENQSRAYFVTLDQAAKVFDACPDGQWRVIFALSRFGGLRCPSEHLLLKWSDIDWANDRFLVTSPKTEHHEGHESRIVPLFPELRKHLEAAWETAAPGTEYVVTRYRSPDQNLRTTFEKIIQRAGLKPWPKLFQNLRSTRETELAETFPIKAVCQWLGNSEAVAKRHYLQVTDEHFARAADHATPGGPAEESGPQSGPRLGDNEHIEHLPRSPKRRFPRENEKTPVLSATTSYPARTRT
jgi:integrase